MKGYIYPLKIKAAEYVEENVLVGCKRCWNSWYEKTFMLKDGVRINGPMNKYDFCDKCKTDTDVGMSLGANE